MKLNKLIFMLSLLSICLSPSPLARANFAKNIFPVSTSLDKPLSNSLYTIDKILAIIYHAEGSSIICQSDLRPGLDGVPRELNQVILDRLMVIDAQKLKITISETDIDRHLAQVQKLYNLTRDNLLKLFKDLGYTYQEGREQLRIMQMIDSIIDYRVRTKILIEDKDVERYYSEHPEVIPAVYKISQVFVPYNPQHSKKQQQETIDLLIKSDAVAPEKWETPITLRSSDIATDKAFIKDLEVGTIVKLQETEDGVRLLRMIEKQPECVIPLKDREKEIRSVIGKERFEMALANYQEELWKCAHVRYADQSMAPQRTIIPPLLPEACN